MNKNVNNKYNNFPFHYFSECQTIVESLWSNEYKMIASVNYPDNYTGNLDCYLEFTAPFDHNLILTFYAFDLESGYDFLEIGNGGTNSSIIAKITGSTNPGSFKSSSNVMWLRFTSDSSINHSGFQANVKAVPVNGE